MIEEELGAMFKRIVLMAKDMPDYVVGKAMMELLEEAMKAVIDRQISSASVEGTFGRPLSAAEKMDRAAAIAEEGPFTS